MTSLDTLPKVLAEYFMTGQMALFGMTGEQTEIAEVHLL
jgi:hypothetical protein